MVVVHQTRRMGMVGVLFLFLLLTIDGVLLLRPLNFCLLLTVQEGSKALAIVSLGSFYPEVLIQ